MLTTFTKVATIHDLEDGRGLRVYVEGVEICLARLEGAYYALLNSCPHMGSPMHFGYVEKGYIECPWHCYRYDLATGARIIWPNAEAIPVFAVRLDGEDIYVGPRDQPNP